MRTVLFKPQAAFVFLVFILALFGIAVNLGTFGNSERDKLKKELAVKVIELGSEGLQERLKNGDKIDEIEYRLAEMVRFKFLNDPPGGDYNLKDNTKTDFSRGQSAFIAEVFNNKKNGYFIEIGAGDGETGSVTLYLERTLGWTGLLIEPDPKKMATIISKHRKACTLCACVNTERYAAKRKFDGKKILREGVKVMTSHTIDRICFPFLTIVTALSRRQLDLLVVDVNGSEYAILNSIPYTLIDIEVISVEFNQDSLAANLTDLMKSKGYASIRLMEYKDNEKKDIIFRKIHKT